jgi:uncharacterized protein YqgQ
MNRIQDIIWFIKEYGFIRWCKYEKCRIEGMEINYSDIFSVDELKKLEQEGIAPWRDK